jgi:hypothetical protein
MWGSFLSKIRVFNRLGLEMYFTDTLHSFVCKSSLIELVKRRNFVLVIIHTHTIITKSNHAANNPIYCPL